MFFSLVIINLTRHLFDYERKTSYLFLPFPDLEEAMTRANKESISIPFGTGICGHVAETKETIYIKDAYQV